MAVNSYSLFVLLYLDFDDQKEISDFFSINYGVPTDCIERGMHLTLYHSRRKLPYYQKKQSLVSIELNVSETRFMVLAPGGENPRTNLIPSKGSVGIRLTKRNIAITDILEIRRDAYKHEPTFKDRKNSSDWRNAFGAPRFQPHIKFLRPGNGLDYNLTTVGAAFRESFQCLKFSKIVVKEYVSKKQ